MSIRNNLIAVVAISFLVVGAMWGIGNLAKPEEESGVPGVAGVTLLAQRSTFNGTNPDVHVKVNVPTRLLVQNDDVVYHDLQIKDKTGAIQSIETGPIPGGRHHLTGITAYKPGIYEYFCSLHPGMQGKIIAEP